MNADTIAFDLFPASGLDNSLFTAVLLGLLLLFLLTESFGWVFTGLVVPGYLASVIVIQPMAGAVIGLESVFTYLVARTLSDWLGPVVPWNRFFGRERFFLILLVSVAVRLAFESALLPAAGASLAEAGWASPSLVGNLYSVGLIVVPLTANMLWKTGLWRGAPQVLLPTLALYGALQLVLIPYTNLSISDFELSYENVALGFLHSPKTYIVLLTAAYLAMRNSLEWGWDSHGIVVLALVALAWLSPLKVLTTVVEVAILVTLTRPLFSTRLLRSANLEGPRRLVIVFSVGFALKFVACHLMAQGYPGLKATDYFGFGYLLPALLALKVLQRGGLAVVLLPTLQTSLVALGLGTGIGLTLALLQPAGQAAGPTVDAPSPTAAGGEDIVRQAQRASGRILTGLPSRDRRATGDQLDAYRRLTHDLVVAGALGERDRQALAAAVGVKLAAAADGDGDLWLATEGEGGTGDLGGWGLLAVREDAEGPLIVEVPHPLAEPGTLVAGALLFLELDARALVVNGIDPAVDPAAAFGLGGRGDLPFAVARRAVAGLPVLEVRRGDSTVASDLWIPRDLPTSLDLGRLRDTVGETELRFDPPPVGDAFGLDPSSERVQLTLSVPGLEATLAAAVPTDPSRPVTTTEEVGLSALGGRPWFTEAVSPRGHRLARETELRLLEREVLAPLLDEGQRAVEDAAMLRRLDGAASLLGYGVRRVVLGDGEVVLLLHETAPATRGWGAVLVRPAASTSHFLAVPRPRTEPHTVDLALHLLRILDGSMLVIGPALSHGQAEPGRDVLAADNLTTLFTHVHRMAYRRSTQDHPAVGLQVRGYSAQHRLDAPLVLSSGVLVSAPEGQLPALHGVTARLAAAGLPTRWYDGSQELIALRGGGIPQLTLARNLDGLPYGVLWASTGLRRQLGGARADVLTQAAREAGLEPRRVWLEERWSPRPGAPTASAASLEQPPGGIGAGMRSTLEAAVALKRTANPGAVEDLIVRARRNGVGLDWIVDPETDRPSVWLRQGTTVLVLDPASPALSGGGPLDDPINAIRLGQVALVRAGE